MVARSSTSVVAWHTNHDPETAPTIPPRPQCGCSHDAWQAKSGKTRSQSTSWFQALYTRNSLRASGLRTNRTPPSPVSGLNALTMWPRLHCSWLPKAAQAPQPNHSVLHEELSEDHGPRQTRRVRLLPYAVQLSCLWASANVQPQAAIPNSPQKNWLPRFSPDSASWVLC